MPSAKRLLKPGHAAVSRRLRFLKEPPEGKSTVEIGAVLSALTGARSSLDQPHDGIDIEVKALTERLLSHKVAFEQNAAGETVG